MNIKVKYIVTSQNPAFQSTEPYGSVPSVLVQEKQGTMIGLTRTSGMDNSRGPGLVEAGVIISSDNKFEIVQLSNVTVME